MLPRQIVLADDYNYEGDWQNGQRHGTGICKWLDGSTYEGEWRDDTKHGEGIFINPDGSR